MTLSLDETGPWQDYPRDQRQNIPGYYVDELIPFDFSDIPLRVHLAKELEGRTPEWPKELIPLIALDINLSVAFLSPLWEGDLQKLLQTQLFSPLTFVVPSDNHKMREEDPILPIHTRVDFKSPCTDIEYDFLTYTDANIRWFSVKYIKPDPEEFDANMSVGLPKSLAGHEQVAHVLALDGIKNIYPDYFDPVFDSDCTDFDYIPQEGKLLISFVQENMHTGLEELKTLEFLQVFLDTDLAEGLNDDLELTEDETLYFVSHYSLDETSPSININ